MLWREGPLVPAASQTSRCVRRLFGGDRPAEPGQLAGGGDGDDRAALAALLHPRPHAVQPALGLPGQCDDRGVGAGLAAPRGSLTLGGWR